MKRNNLNHIVKWHEWLDREKEELTKSKINPLTLVDIGNNCPSKDQPMPSKPTVLKISDTPSIDISSLLPEPPKSPFKPRQDGNNEKLAPISKPKPVTVIGTSNLPSKDPPTFHQPATPNSRGALNVNVRSNPAAKKTDLSRAFAPTFMNSPSVKRKATSPADKDKLFKTRKKAPQLSEEERKLRNKQNNEKRKLKKQEEKQKALELEEERELKVQALMRLLKEEQDKVRVLENRI